MHGAPRDLSSRKTRCFAQRSLPIDGHESKKGDVHDLKEVIMCYVGKHEIRVLKHKNTKEKLE